MAVYTLPELPYDYAALEPHISGRIMELHHDKHHKAYVDKLNELVAGTEWDGKSLEDIVKGTYQKGAVAQNGIFNNASQHWNHAQFWEMMAPNPGAMPSELERAITDSFGSVDDFKKKFTEAGVGQFGSGWAWLQVKGGKLEIAKTPNGENPLVHGAVPILGVDVWEHSYYIDFRNARPKYIENFLDKLVNWENVASRM